MRRSELIQLLTAVQTTDPDPVVELDIDIFSRLGASPGSRQERRVVDVKAGYRSETVRIVGCGALTPAEEARIDGGLYRREYEAYEVHWNGLRNEDRRVLLIRANLEELGIRYWVYEHDAWDELPRRIQELIMLRIELPV